MAIYFSRYQPSHLPLDSFMQKALRLADPSQREALLQAVNFDLPDHALTGMWEQGGQTIHADVQPFHPLVSIARLGDEALFARAMELANERSTQAIYLNDRRNMVTLSDWTSAGVLNAVVAHGTVAMLKSLVAKLLERSRMTRQLNLSSSNDGPNPWQALAKHGDRNLSTKDYRAKLKILDQYLRACQRGNFNTSRGKKPPSDGAPPLTAWEKRMRRAVYTHALSEAATACNPNMVEAILETRHAAVEIGHVDAAIAAGGLDVAARLLETGLPAMMDLPLVDDKDHRNYCAGPRASLSWGEVESALGALCKTVAQWESVDEENHPRLAPWQSYQLQHVERVLWPLFDLRARFPQTDEVSSNVAEQCSRLTSSLWPVLRRLDEVGAARAFECLVARHPEGHDLGLLPTLKQWASLLEGAACPWQDLQCARLAHLSPQDLDTYLKRLSDNLEEAWIQSDGVSYDPVVVLEKLWSVSPNPALPPVFQWAQQVLVGMRLSEERHAAIHRLLLERAVPRVPERNRLGPRL